ncbi:MAG TPA: alpha/beta hydrolase [Mycobacterium sp.]
MIDRFSLWLGAAVVTAGMSAAMLAGTGVAAADTGSGSDAGGATSSQSTKPAEKKADSKKKKPTADPSSSTRSDSAPADSKPADDADKPKQDTTETTDPTPTGKPDADDADDDDVAADPPPTATNDHKKTEVQQPSRHLTKPVTATPEPDIDPAVDAKSQDVTVEPEVTKPAEEVQQVVTAGRSQARTKDAAPQTAAVAFAAAAPSTAEVTSTAAASPLSGLLSAIGTFVFNLYGLATRLVGGPPILPPNSTVTVSSSTLRLDCADGYEVPADWYIPDSADPPTRLIYLQHGFLAQGPWYSYTAAALAEQTNSIVVAPSITSNFLSCDACWLGAPPMQQAVANLFEDDNTALADSALAAGYTGPIPDRVVLVGHSLGGGLVAGTAGYMVKNRTADRLAGVIMLDGVGLDDTMTSSLEKVPDDIPIYQLGAPEYFWNQFGVGSHALLEARPDRFVGVTLVGGSHVDSMQGGNPLIQFSQELVAGFTLPENVAAAQMLMVGWANDMFACTQDSCTRDDGIYLDPSQEFTLDTPAGEATMVALPNSLTKPFWLNPLQALVPRGNSFFVFEPTCGPDSMAGASCKGSMAA